MVHRKAMGKPGEEMSPVRPKREWVSWYVKEAYKNDEDLPESVVTGQGAMILNWNIVVLDCL